MCYDVAYQTKRSLEYAKKRAADPKTVEELEDLWEKVREIQPVRFHASGFEHPSLPCYLDEAPLQPQHLYWGLVPFWTKDQKGVYQMANKTLNARGETIFEKPAFRDAAKKRRCLVVIDHFYEHHHHKGKTYPHLVKLKNDEPMTLAGLWSEWHDRESGKKLRSLSIVTTEGNELLERIHNNPKLKGPRMPLLLPRELQDEWLQPVEDELDQEKINELIKPYPAEEMEAWPVGRLRGKNAVGNQPEALEKVNYPELGQEEME